MRTPDTGAVPYLLTVAPVPEPDHRDPRYAITAPAPSRLDSAPCAVNADPPEMPWSAAIGLVIRCPDQPPEQNLRDQSPTRRPSSSPGVHVQDGRQRHRERRVLRHRRRYPPSAERPSPRAQQVPSGLEWSGDCVRVIPNRFPTPESRNRPEKTSAAKLLQYNNLAALSMVAGVGFEPTTFRL